jgi:hypothetical protein
MDKRMTSPRKKSSQADIESMVDANAAALGLRLEAAHRPGVLLNFERIALQAQTLMEFPLGDETELAPVFSHDQR